MADIYFKFYRPFWYKPIKYSSSIFNNIDRVSPALAILKSISGIFQLNKYTKVADVKIPDFEPKLPILDSYFIDHFDFE